MPRVDYFAGLDLGQPHEFSALAVVERQVVRDEMTYAVRHLQRWPIGTPYPVIADEVSVLRDQDDLDDAPLTADQTGVGRAVVELFRRWNDEHIHRIVITTGHSVSHGEGGATLLPKKELVATLQVSLQSRRLKVASCLPLADMLIREMASFKAKLATVESDELASWREREHDDLVLAAALAVWEGERTPIHHPLPSGLCGGAFERWLPGTEY